MSKQAMAVAVTAGPHRSSRGIRNDMYNGRNGWHTVYIAVPSMRPEYLRALRRMSHNFEMKAKVPVTIITDSRSS